MKVSCYIVIQDVRYFYNKQYAIQHLVNKLSFFRSTYSTKTNCRLMRSPIPVSDYEIPCTSSWCISSASQTADSHILVEYKTERLSAIKSFNKLLCLNYGGKHFCIVSIVCRRRWITVLQLRNDCFNDLLFVYRFWKWIPILSLIHARFYVSTNGVCLWIQNRNAGQKNYEFEPLDRRKFDKNKSILSKSWDVSFFAWYQHNFVYNLVLIYSLLHALYHL